MKRAAPMRKLSRWWASILVLGWLLSWVPTALLAAAPAMRPFVVDLPNHTLRFSLPEEIARQMSPLQADPRFDPKTSDTYERDGFRFLASKYYQFQRPFWAGAYGALKFEFSVVRREAKYRDEIITLGGLDRYLNWWRARLRDKDGYIFSQAELSGRRWVYQHRNTFGQVAQGAEEMQGFSCPIDETMFLDVGFWITETVPGSAAKWTPQAEAFREAIKATIVLQPKSAPSAPLPGPRAQVPVPATPR